MMVNRWCKMMLMVPAMMLIVLMVLVMPVMMVLVPSRPLRF